MSVDTTCAWCGEPWDVYGLRHDGWDYLHREHAEQLGILNDYDAASAGDTEATARVGRKVYVATLSGRGCPSKDCGFGHGSNDGPHREDQLKELVFDGITDDDPLLFM